MATTRPSAKKPFVSSIPLWMRTDQPRQQGMDYWKGPHSKIISVTPGFEEYRQIHLAENNPGLWSAISGVETVIPAERRIDGVAEVTFTSLLSPLRGRKQTKLAYQDEVNVFRRTLVYAGPPYSARWYDAVGPGEKVGARSLIYLRRREGVKTRAFRTQLKAIQKWGRSAPADLSIITQPTLIANGDNDRMVPSVLSEDMHRRIPGSELVIYPDSGHGGIFQFHDKFAPVAVEFLAR